MAYAYSSLYQRVRAILNLNPLVSLCAISRKLGVERHTLEKALRLTAAKSFRELRRQLAFSRACRLLGGRAGSTNQVHLFPLEM